MPDQPATAVLRRDRTSLGVALVLGAVVAWSTAGLFVRLVGLDAWTVLFWRGLFATLAIAGVLAGLHGRGLATAVRGLGGAGWLVAACDCVASVTFVGALSLTTVADVVVIYATLPLATAIVARLWLGEAVGPGVVAASLVALAGVAVAAGDASGEGSLPGDLLAVAMTLTMAVMVVLLRRCERRGGGVGTPMAPAALASAAMTTLVAWPFAAAGPPAGDTLVLLALSGSVEMGLGLLLFVSGSGLVRPARAALLCCLEIPLAPLWVWLAVGEVPGPATALGGSIVLAAVAGHLVGAARPAPRPAPAGAA